MSDLNKNFSVPVLPFIFHPVLALITTSIPILLIAAIIRDRFVEIFSLFQHLDRHPIQGSFIDKVSVKISDG